MDDFSGLEYDQESVSEEDVVSKTNNLLSQFNLPTQVTSVTDITASLFVVLYESLFSDRLPSIVRQPVTKEDEVYNCQMVVDVLSADVIKDNLSHIRGLDIVDGKVQAINNLLDIFTFLYEYVIKQIESDGPTDTEDERCSVEGVRSLERLDDIGRRPSPLHGVECLETAGRGEGGAGGDLGINGLGAAGGNKDLGEGKVSTQLAMMSDAAISSIRPNSSVITGHCAAHDSTQDLIQEGERLERHHQEIKERLELKEQDQPGKFDFIGVRPIPASVERRMASPLPAAGTGDAYLDSALPVSSTVPQDGRPADRSAHSLIHLSATEPLPPRTQMQPSTQRLFSTVGAFPYEGPTRQIPEKPYPEPAMKGLSSSYTDLQDMVQHTAAMTRAAIDSSPAASRRLNQHLDITDLSHERRRLPLSEASELARELNLGKSPAHSYGASDAVASGSGRELRRSALQDMSDQDRENIPPKTYSIPPNTDYLKSSLSKPANRQRPGKRSPPRLRSSIPARVQAQSQELDRLKERFVDVLAEVHGADYESEVREVRQRQAAVKGAREVRGKKETERGERMSSKLQGLGKPGLADAQRHLETEEALYGRKHDYLRKLYEEEFEDVVDEVKGLVKRDHTLMKQMDDEYRKLMLVAEKAKKSKPTPKPKGYLLPTTKKTKKKVQKKPMNSKNVSKNQENVRERPLDVGEDEELMPLLMEEFPHLHLSGHTWHELWRKGLNQIENLTRAYEENKRRKSKAQSQLEEAARKHEILAAIVRKQVEHNQRSREVKEQKRQSVSVKNKMHEKRSQSARARRYYNEYQVRARSKMLKRRTREELVFKNLFKDGLAIQKERIREVQGYAKEQRTVQAKKRQDEIDSLENYYRDQFEMLVGKLVQDREEMTAREKAHQKVLTQMKRDLRVKMEREIGEIQSEMFRDEDDTYFRQLAADRLRQELHMAKFQTRV